MEKEISYRPVGFVRRNFVFYSGFRIGISGYAENYDETELNNRNLCINGPDRFLLFII